MNQEPRTTNQEPSKPSSTDQNEVLVKVEGVSKKFCRSLKKSLWYGVCDIAAELSPFGGRSAVPSAEVPSSSLETEPRTTNQEQRTAAGANQELRTKNQEPPRARDEDLRPGEFYAVRDVSFELRRGECLGLIGHNGAGKTTLLKMLNGLIKPDSGSITMRGRVGALIALGAGFNPILTGRENIYVNGTVLGFSKKELDERIEDIIDFAEIREFIDAPVQSYSSGMQVRLGFAISTTLDPDILLLDEVLAVGDVSFRLKCYSRVDQLRKKAAVIFVSHSVEHIGRICQSALLLKAGKILHYGSVPTALQLYEAGNRDPSERGSSKHLHPPLLSATCQLLSSSIQTGENVKIRLEITSDETIETSLRTTIFHAVDQQVVGTAESILADSSSVVLSKGNNSFELEIESLNLRSGRYVVAVAVFEALTKGLIFADRGSLILNVSSPFYSESHHLMALKVTSL